MKYTPLLLLLLAACATPGPRTPKADPLPALPYAFDVDANGELVLVKDAINGDLPGDGSLDAIRALVAPDSWSRGALLVDGNTLLIRNTAAVCDAARDALASIRSADQRVFKVTARLFRVSGEHLADLRNLGPAEGALASRFRRDRLSGITSGWLKEGAETHAAPRISVMAGQPGQISITNQFAYIRGWERSNESWDPVVGVVNEGLSLALVAAPNGSRKDETALAVSLQSSALVETAPRVLHIRFEDRIVELPGLATARVGGRFALGREDALLLVTRNPDRSDTAHPLLAIVVEVD